MRRSVVAFVAALLLGAWSTLLVDDSFPEWLGTGFTWVVGGWPGYSSSLLCWHGTSLETNREGRER